MTKYCLYFICYFLCLASCQTTDSKAKSELVLQDQEQQNEILYPFLGVDKIRYQIFKVEGEQQGQAIVRQRNNFLQDFFRQSKDPYFGRERWSSQCLEKNKVGEPGQVNGHFGFLAQLTVDNLWNPGICTPEAIASVFMIIFCEQSNRVVLVQGTGEQRERLQISCSKSLSVTVRKN